MTAEAAKTFKHLTFTARSESKMGVAARMFFANGYGVSVICGPYTYGGDQGLYELAVLAGVEGDSRLCYDTPVTSDVEGHLTPRRVSALMAKVQALPVRARVEA